MRAVCGVAGRFVRELERGGAEIGDLDGMGIITEGRDDMHVVDCLLYSQLFREERGISCYCYVVMIYHRVTSRVIDHRSSTGTG